MCPRPCTAAETWAGPTWRGARHYSPLAVYAQSKLALTMFTRSFAEANSGHLSALSVHPGVIATQLWHHLYLGGGLCEMPHIEHQRVGEAPSPQPPSSLAEA